MSAIPEPGASISVGSTYIVLLAMLVLVWMVTGVIVVIVRAIRHRSPAQT